MKRWIAGALGALTVLAAAAPADAFLYVRGNNSRSGDLVAVWIKNGFELIVNLGPVEALVEGPLVDFEVPAEFDNTLEGAKFTALAVPNPAAVFTGLGIDPPLVQNNIALTTLGDPGVISFTQTGDAQAQLDPPIASQTWLNLLGTIPAAGQTGVVENSNDSALISTTLYASYTGIIGFATDAIANSLTLSTATIVAEGTGFEIPLYEVFQTVEIVGEDFVTGTEVIQLGSISGDDGSSGTAEITFAPEPGTTLLGGIACASLAWIAQRRRSPTVPA